MGIAIFGATFVDIKGYPLDKYIPAGRNVGRIEMVDGGVGRNVAEDIANIGLKPTFVSLVDDTPNGEAVVRHLKEQDVDTTYMRAKKDGMGTWLAIFDNQGDVISSISKRPDLSGIGDILDEYGEKIISECDSVALELDLEKEPVAKVFALAEKYNKKVFALVSNMSIAVERRKMIKKTACFICNKQEAGIFFSTEYQDLGKDEMVEVIRNAVVSAGIPAMVVTMGDEGAVYADCNGYAGWCPALKIEVKDTTGAGDAFFAGVCAAVTYGKSLKEACTIGTRLAASVISTSESVCPHFTREEIGL